ncbi:MAG TPA: ABC transporter ATP-binding protein [Verrucomicrobiae bacterium]|nr:ABC transporter ATP-binding protein [Verrucomicrobiae bacterium]
MSDIAISVSNLSKRYRIGHANNVDWGLRHAIEKFLRNPFKWWRNRKIQTEDFWALDDVSFEVKNGEVLGIIGRNGAGKSTLLKILSRITEPTTGRISICGRVASLLEVGTGFHPELTGRENIYLNGAILGMTRAEIKRKFDEIVAFSEVERFLDTPVKRYSSGMYVRLAFAVAAHLEPEILIVDEVLAVGDAQFQKKCIGKMQDVATREGRTVLFVSHNMGSLVQFCERGILLEHGKVAAQGPIDLVVKHYFSSAAKNAVWKANPHDAFRPQKKVFFRRVELLDADGAPSTELDVHKHFFVHMEYEVPRAFKPVELSVRILTTDGAPVMTSMLSDCEQSAPEIEKHGVYRATVRIPGMFLMPGSYLINVAAHAGAGEVFDSLPGIFGFIVLDTGTNYTKYQHNHHMGVVMRALDWQDELVAMRNGHEFPDIKIAEAI